MKSLVTTLIEQYMSVNLGIAVNEEKDPLQEYYEKEGGEKWTPTHEVDDKFKKYETDDTTSNMKLVEVFKVKSKSDEEEYYIAKFYGGLNGSGNWRHYLQDIQSIIEGIKDSYIVKLDVDVADDVWSLYVGINKDAI